MEVRKLRPEEHLRTRKLWEKIFTEDTSEFLDYYYTVKTKENEIYVIEDEGEIVAMLHLNPYTMRVKNDLYQTHYIVAVATHKEYRRQGLMAKLMNHVIQVMKDRGELFTFLMHIISRLVFNLSMNRNRERCWVSSQSNSILIFPTQCQKIVKKLQIMRIKNCQLMTW